MNITNSQLSEQFSQVLKEPTVLGQYAALFKMKKSYKHSDFYKATKMPIKEAYETFIKGIVIDLVKQISVYNSFDAIVDKVQELLDSLDLSNVIGILDAFADRFNVSELLTEKEKLAEIISTLK